MYTHLRNSLDSFEVREMTVDVVIKGYYILRLVAN